MELIEGGNNAVTLVGPNANVGTAQNMGKNAGGSMCFCVWVGGARVRGGNQVFFIRKIVQFQWRKQLWQFGGWALQWRKQLWQSFEDGPFSGVSD